MAPRLTGLLPEGCPLVYVGRHEAASPATGSHQVHLSEQQEIVQQALEAGTPEAEGSPRAGGRRAKR